MSSNRKFFYLSQLFVAVSYFFAWSQMGLLILDLPYYELPVDKKYIEFPVLAIYLIIPFIQLIGVLKYKSKGSLYSVLLLLCLSIIPAVNQLLHFISMSIAYFKTGFAHCSCHPPAEAKDRILFLLLVLLSIYIIQSKLYTKLYKIRRYKLLLYLPLMIFYGVVFFIVYRYFFVAESNGLLAFRDMIW